jgi:Rps23 Pro-64 3,4-dihydroxylase Tpa1-like proline 4-hydroxylase
MDTTPPTRAHYAELICQRLRATEHQFRQDFARVPELRHFVVDELLPAPLALTLFHAFPPLEHMIYKNTPREHKYAGNQMDRFPHCLEELVFAFEHPDVMACIAAITGIDRLEGDPLLYAGGISDMRKGHFVRPHLDNSHDLKRERYRVLNLLLYISPERTEASGGHLELWPNGLNGEPITITSRFNRLLVMETTDRSWHAVSPITDDMPRRALYYSYFRATPIGTQDYFQVTAMRAWPGERILDTLLQLDIKLRMGIRKLFPLGLRRKPPIYRR